MFGYSFKDIFVRIKNLYVFLIESLKPYDKHIDEIISYIIDNCKYMGQTTYNSMLFVFDESSYVTITYDTRYGGYCVYGFHQIGDGNNEIWNNGNPSRTVLYRLLNMVELSDNNNKVYKFIENSYTLMDTRTCAEKFIDNYIKKDS